MRIETIQTMEDWAALQSDWQALLQHSHQNTPFLTYEFQRAWWQHLGGGEWGDANLHILTGRDESGRLLGIAPLFAAGDKLLFIGSHEIADFLDFIARPEDLPAFIQAVFTHLSGMAGWSSLELDNLLDDSATQPAAQTAAAAAGWAAELETVQPSPYLTIPASLDAYGDMLDSKQAHELRRKLRQAARNPLPVALEVVDSSHSEMAPALDDFFALMTQEADKAAFLTPAMRAQMEAIGAAAAAGGWLQLGFLKVGAERVAAFMSFDYQNRVWAYNSGFNNQHARLSPGWLLMAYMVQWCIDNGRGVFDFMRGGEEYKYRFGAQDRFVQRLTIKRG
ncbi:MAG: GNAT family N-acetyltransferase [Anaerolineales bacterium]|nr:GNAT family N-acetyltransferase [Anaerolineales bacterium]